MPWSIKKLVRAFSTIVKIAVHRKQKDIKFTLKYGQDDSVKFQTSTKKAIALKTCKFNLELLLLLKKAFFTHRLATAFLARSNKQGISLESPQLRITAVEAVTFRDPELKKRIF